METLRHDTRHGDNMEKINVFNINDEKTLEAMIEWYDQGSNTATYIRKEVMRLYQQRRSETY